MLDLAEMARHRGRPLVLGHRGAPREIAENTAASFKRALDLGADGVEMDVRCTADGILICHHDRTISSWQSVSRLTYRQLLAILRPLGQTVTALKSALKTVAGRGISDIEIKQPGIERKVIEMARHELPKGSYFFSSFHPDTVTLCRRIAPSVPSYLIIGTRLTPRDILRLVQSCRANGAVLRQSVASPQVMKILTSHRLTAAVWTVNRKTRAAFYATLGASAIVTDEPLAISQAFLSPVQT